MTNIQFGMNVVDGPVCISNGWQLVKRSYGMYLGILFIALLLSAIPLVNLFLVGPIFAGVYYVLLRDMRNEPVEFSMMFKGFDRYVPAMVVGLIQAFPGAVYQLIRIGLNISEVAVGGGRRPDPAAEPIVAGLSMLGLLLGIFFMVFSIVWGFIFFFAMPILAEQDLDPIQVIKLSARAAFNNIGGIVVLMLLEIGISLLGFLACCIGMFFVFPVIFAANAFAYRQVFPISGQPFATTPPPPHQYGNEYGQGF